MSEEVEKYLFQRLQYVVDTPHEHELLTNLYGLRKLFGEMRDLLDASPTGKIISEEDWPKVRREKLYHVNNLLTEWQAITKTLGLVHTPNSISAAYHLSKKLNKVKRDLKGGDGTESKHPISSFFQTKYEESLPQKTLQNHRWSSRYVDPKKVHGLDAKAMSLERELTGSENDFKAIGIVGMPGIGKTTLAQLIFNQTKVKEHFLPRIWVSMSKQPDQEDDYNMKDIVERILRSLGIEEEIIKLTFERSELEGLIFALRMQLTDKKYLIVLDDVEKDFGKLNSGSLVKNREMMKKLEYGLPKGSGGTVIMTSRDEKVAEGMVGEENIHIMVPLPDPNSCWLIFKDSVQKDLKEFPKNLEGFEEEIVRKCGGLPLSAKLMGQIVNQRLKERRTENQNPEVDQPLIQKDNQVMLDQLIETENREVQTEKEPENQPLQTIDYIDMENQESIEQPELENEETTEDFQTLQTENQELTEIESEELTEKPEESQLSEGESENQPSEDDVVSENEQPDEQMQKQTETEELTESETEDQPPQQKDDNASENEQLTMQKEMETDELTENETEDQPPPHKDDEESENEQPTMQKETETKELTEDETEEQLPQKDDEVPENEQLTMQKETETNELTENETEDQPPPKKDDEMSEFEQLATQKEAETKELTENETEDQLPQQQKDDEVSENYQTIEQLQKEADNEELTENETEGPLPSQEQGQVSEDEQTTEHLQTKTDNEEQTKQQSVSLLIENHQLQTTTGLTEQSEEPQLAEIENWEVIEKPEMDN